MVMTIAIYIDYMILYDDGDDNKLMVMVRIIMMMVMITMMIIHLTNIISSISMFEVKHLQREVATQSD